MALISRAPRRQPWIFAPEGEVAIRVREIPIAQGRAAAAHWLGFAGVAGEAAFEAFVPAPIVEAYIQNYQPFFRWDDLDEAGQIAALNWLVAVLMSGASGPILAFQPIMNRRLALPAAPCGDDLAYEIVRDGLPLVALVRPDDFLRARLAQASAQQKLDRTVAGDVGLVLRFSLGFERSSAADVKTLRIGDAIVPDFLRPGAYVALIGPFAQFCRIDGDTATLSGPILKEPNEELRGYLMSELDVDKMPVGDLPVILTFEIGQVQTTLDELVSIGSGAVFKFEQARPGAVNIMAGARRLGVGEIFSLDGRTAVRIVSLD